MMGIQNTNDLNRKSGSYLEPDPQWSNSGKNIHLTEKHNKKTTIWRHLTINPVQKAYQEVISTIYYYEFDARLQVLPKASGTRNQKCVAAIVVMVM